MVARNVPFNQLSAFLRRVPKLMPLNVENALRALAESEEGPKQAIFDIVASTPSSIVPGKMDRVWTGNMQESGEGRVKSVGERIHFDFGWFDLSDDEYYIGVQEEGGYLRDGTEIWPMNALEQIADMLVEDRLLWDALQDAIRATWRDKVYG